LRHAPYYTSGGLSYDAATLTALAEQVRAAVETAPVDATAGFDPESEEPFTYVDEVNGKQVDTAALVEELEQNVLSLRGGAIDVRTTDVPPKVTRAALQANLTCIAVVTTPIASSSTEGRNANVRIGLDRINGLMVTPDERVSFNKIAGRRADPKNGYQEALEIAYGEYVTGIGGGICQVSTTLYQAVLRAGLKVEERSAHAIPSNYADKGQDATVSDNGADFVFRNNTEYPMYFRARLVEDTKAKTKRCEIAVYGRPLPNGLRYTLESRQIGRDLEPDPDKVYIPDKQQQYVTYKDEEKEVAPKRVGYHVETYLVELRSDGMEVGRQLISEDVYNPRPAQVYQGTQVRE
jgi:vancomycin resistance protein YoaR